LDYSAEKDNAALLNVAREILHGWKSEGPIRAGLPMKRQSRQATNERFVRLERDELRSSRQFLESDRTRRL
jgi:hypothetical protein